MSVYSSYHQKQTKVMCFLHASPTLVFKKEDKMLSKDSFQVILQSSCLCNGNQKMVMERPLHPDLHY
jgi:hypothetical protein